MNNNMITPEQIHSLQFTFIDVSSKEGHEFMVNGLEVGYMDGDKKVTQELDVNDDAFYDIAKGIITSISAMINFKNGQ